MIHHAPPDESDFDKNIPSAETSNSIHHALRDESLGAVLDAVFSNQRAQSNSSSSVFQPNLSWTHYRSLITNCGDFLRNSMSLALDALMLVDFVVY